MATAILTSGTCAKQDIYNLIKNTLITAGWSNVSSNASDFDVLTSPGEAGDKALVIQMRPSDSAAANPVTTTDLNKMSYRLIDSYVPGAAGAVGVVGRPALAWTDLFICPNGTTATPKDTVVNYKIFADKNKLILAIFYPVALNLTPTLIYLGIPDSTYCTEPGSRGFLVAHSYSGVAANSISIDNTPGGLSSITAPETVPIVCTLAPKNPNTAGVYTTSEVYYGNATEGLRGKLDGIIAMPNNSVVTGDIIQITMDDASVQQYSVLVLSTGTNSFPSGAMAVRIA